MRTSTVPAQITTVEDKVVGELSLVQFLLLSAPIFCGAAIVVALPPFFALAPYKIVITVCLAVFFCTLAIRIKGKILLSWLLVLVRYGLRPRLYLFNKNDTHLRDIPKPEAPQVTTQKQEPKTAARVQLPNLSTAELVQVEQLIANPQANLHFRTNKKGGLSVHITEVR